MSIAEGMGLLTRGSVEETRLIIEGGLTNQGHEPRNVQVEVVVEEGDGTTINLRDSQGPLVKAHIRGMANVGKQETARDDSAGDGDQEHEFRCKGSGSEETNKLEEAHTQNGELQNLNNELTSQVSALQREVRTLTDNLRRETERVSKVWRMSFEQVSSFDEAITEKYVEIDSIKAGIAELETASTRLVALPTTGMCAHSLASPRVGLLITNGEGICP